MAGTPTYDHERVQLNLARVRKGGAIFEIVVDPDKAVAWKENAGAGDVSEILKAEEIFSDAKKGMAASEHQLTSIFGTDDPLKVAQIILEEGEIQITQQHREKLREEKRRKLIDLIHTNAIDPRSGNPHPSKRIELAMDEAKVRIDEFKRAEDQMQETVKKLMPVLPIRIERAKLIIHLPAAIAAKLYSTVQQYGSMVDETWLNDGSWRCTVEIPAGLKNELIDTLNSKTHGSVTIELLK